MVLSIIRPFYMAFAHLFKTTFTVKYPYEVLRPSERYRGRPMLNLERCVGCGVCVWICPNKALNMVKVGDLKLPQLDAGRCMFCGLCADFCPRIAMVMTQHYELAEYNRKSLIYSPERFSQPPKQFDGKLMSVKKIRKHFGVTHG